MIDDEDPHSVYWHVPSYIVQMRPCAWKNNYYEWYGRRCMRHDWMARHQHASGGCHLSVRNERNIRTSIRTSSRTPAIISEGGRYYLFVIAEQDLHDGVGSPWLKAQTRVIYLTFLHDSVDSHIHLFNQGAVVVIAICGLVVVLRRCCGDGGSKSPPCRQKICCRYAKAVELTIGFCHVGFEVRPTLLVVVASRTYPSRTVDHRPGNNFSCCSWFR